MILNREYSDIERARIYSSLFSRSRFSKIINNDLSEINREIINLEGSLIEPSLDYLTYFNHIYHYLSTNYRNEYIYKNTLINELLLKEYSCHKSVIFSEFKVGNSIADMTIFNGESKVFEIKTDLDNRTRLNGQLFDYLRLFQRCYIVVDEKLAESYIDVDEHVGILTISKVGRSLKLSTYRECIKRDLIDVDVLMSTLRTYEYKEIVSSYFGSIPDVSSYTMYEECKELIKEIPYKTLNSMFLGLMKRRKNVTRYLRKTPMSLRQMQLCLSLGDKKISEVKNILMNTIKL